MTHALQEGDRLEVLRPLRVDPKVARRERFQRQGAKTAGLFAKRRTGAKARLLAINNDAFLFIFPAIEGLSNARPVGR
jgi:hypothetical protein